MEVIRTTEAPEPVGSYSQAIRSNGTLFCSGQIPLRPDGTIVDGDAAEQTKQVLANLSEVLHAGGCTFEHIVQATIYLTDINDFAVVNEVYEGYVSSEHPPARVTVEVSRLPKDAKVEIALVAHCE